jgi:hypothetical protein
MAKSRLRRLLHREPAKARYLAWHAAQIIGMAREYTIHTPCETMRVFTGHILLLAIVRYTFLQGDGMDHEHQREIVELDKLPSASSAQDRGSIDRWIERGGPAVLRGSQPIYVSDPDPFPLLRTLALETMQNMQIRGLANKFYIVLQMFDL